MARKDVGVDPTAGERKTFHVVIVYSIFPF